MRLNSRLVEEECGRRSDMASMDTWEDARGPARFTEMTRGSVCGMLAGAAVDAGAANGFKRAVLWLVSCNMHQANSHLHS